MVAGVKPGIRGYMGATVFFPNSCNAWVKVEVNVRLEAVW